MVKIGDFVRFIGSGETEISMGGIKAKELSDHAMLITGIDTDKKETDAYIEAIVKGTKTTVFLREDEIEMCNFMFLNNYGEKWVATLNREGELYLAGSESEWTWVRYDKNPTGNHFVFNESEKKFIESILFTKNI